MKNSQRFLLMTDFLTGRKKILFFSIVLTTVSFLLFDLVITLMAEQSYEYRSYEEMYTDPDTVYRVDFTYMDEENDMLCGGASFLELKNELGNLDGVSAAGGYLYGKMRFDELFTDESYSDLMGECRVSDFDLPIMEGESRVLMLDEESLSYLKLAVGEETLKQFLQPDGDFWPVLAGSAFRGLLSEGQELTYGEQKLRVIGFLDENATWPVVGGSGIFFYQLQKLDYQFVIRLYDIREKGTYATLNSLYLAAEPGTDSIALSEQVKAIGEKYDLLLSASRVSDILDSASAEQSAAEGMYRKLLWFMFLLCILTAVSSAVISVMVELRKIGIWYANGVLPSDVRWMIRMEQFVKIVLSAALAYGFGSWYANQSTEVYRLLHSGYTLRRSLLAAGVIYVLSAGVPCIYISRLHIVKLLQTKE